MKEVLIKRLLVSGTYVVSKALLFVDWALLSNKVLSNCSIFSVLCLIKVVSIFPLIFSLKSVVICSTSVIILLDLIELVGFEVIIFVEKLYFSLELSELIIVLSLYKEESLSLEGTVLGILFSVELILSVVKDISELDIKNLSVVSIIP